MHRLQVRRRNIVTLINIATCVAGVVGMHASLERLGFILSVSKLVVIPRLGSKTCLIPSTVLPSRLYLELQGNSTH